MALATRRRVTRWTRKVSPRFTAAIDPLEVLEPHELAEFVAKADRILYEAAPRTSAGVYRDAERAFRRWLRLAGRLIGEEIDDLAPRRRVPLRKVDFTASSATWSRLEGELREVVTDVYRQVNADALGAVASELNLAYDPGLRETLAPDIQSNIGRQVARITESSRSELAAAVATATERGYSADQLARGVRADGFPGLRTLVDRWGENGIHDRAGLIALTETGTGYNLSALNAYERSGLVDQVTVFDGENCGWTTHSDPQSANGMRVSLDEAKAHPLAHPRCQRAFGAIVGGAPPKGAPGAQVPPPRQLGPQPGPLPFEVNARATSARVYSEAARDAPEVTRLLQDLERRGLGNMQGLDYRLKADMDRTIEKILTDIARGDAYGDAARVKDALRYTFVNEPGVYRANVRAISEALEAAGYRAIKWKDNWGSALSKDVNTAWLSPTGGRFEVQFHTPASWYRKMTAGPIDAATGRALPASHKVYDEFRVLADGAPERPGLEDLLRRIWADVDAPPGEAWAPRLWDDVAALPAPSPLARYANQLGVFDDPAVIRIRAELDEVLGKLETTPMVDLAAYRPLMQASQRLQATLDDALWDARLRIERQVSTLSAAEARAALAEVSETRRLVEDAMLTARRLGTADARVQANRLMLRYQDLTDLQERLVRQVPLADRIAPPPTLGGAMAQRAYDSLRQVYGVIEDELGLRTRWSGNVQIGGIRLRAAAGEFGWDDAIRLAPSTTRYSDADYWAVIVHEAFHGVAPLTPNQLLFAQGWEEGVVEMAAHTFAPRILARLGLKVDEGFHSYAKWTAPLERIRATLDLEPEDFYGELLRLPATRRGTWVDRALDALAAKGGDAEAIAAARRAMLKLGQRQGRT